MLVKNIVMSSGGDCTISVGNDMKTTVGGDATTSISHNHKLTSKNSSEAVSQDKTDFRRG